MKLINKTLNRNYVSLLLALIRIQLIKTSSEVDLKADLSFGKAIYYYDNQTINISLSIFMVNIWYLLIALYTG